VDLLLQVSFFLLLDSNILINELRIPLAHPVLTRITYPTELLTSCFDLFQFREIPFALEFLTLNTHSIFKFIFSDDRLRFLLCKLLIDIVRNLKVLHQHLLSLVTPIDISDALLIIVKVPHMSGPVLTQHLVSTRANIANGEAFLNLLFALLSLTSKLLFWKLVSIITRDTWLI
jgi:hypothetical protein